MTDEKTVTEEERDKYRAEAEKLRAEADKLRAEDARAGRQADAEEQKTLAEASKLKAETERAVAEARLAGYATEVGRIAHDEQLRKEKHELAKDQYHHRYNFNSEVTTSSVKAAIEQFTQWDRGDGAQEYELVLNSPGGDVIAGFALIDYLSDLRARNNRVTTIALGWAASMAGVILQVGDKRIMGKNSILLIHEASFSAHGSYGEIQDWVKLADLMHDHILDLFVQRAKEAKDAGTAEIAATKAFIKKNWNRKDWWLSGQDALKYGFCDALQ